MKKTAIFGIVAVLLIGIVATTAFAMPFGIGKMSWQTEEMTAALESGDYDAYIEALDNSDRPFMAQHLTEEQFHARAENFQQMQEKRQEMEQVREDALNALEAGDYDAWVEAYSGLDNIPPIVEQITEDNFDTYRELHNARMSWDFEKVQELSKELGIEGSGFGFEGGFGRGHSMGGERGSGKILGNGMKSGNCPFSQNTQE